MATDTVTVAAADLGASSGRVMVARVGPDRLDLTEVHRFPNRPVRLGPTLHWDALALYRGVLDGLTAAARTGGLDGIGIDSWAVDYGLLDGTGALIGNPISYRDHRTDGVMAAVHAQLGAQHLYRTTGLQSLPFNTIYQLVAARDTPSFAQARRLLLLPDLLAYWLTGNDGAEITNASTTGLLDATSRTWSGALLAALELDPALLGKLRQPGEEIGRLLPAVAEETGLSHTVPVIAVGSHDTASAVVAVPAATPRFAYVSCGTWSLVGVELRAPVLGEASRAANFTNETGVDGTVRYLRNVMGLWLLQESVRTWNTSGSATDLDALLRAAAGEPALASVIDPDDPMFLPPGDMPARIRQACRRTGQPVPESPAAVTRCILDSLALAQARAVRQARELSGQDVEVVHVVGGGARNALLCQLTADACGLPVLAGPVEATALGNTLVQARALGAVTGELDELRGLIRAHTSVLAYSASGDARAWQLAESRIHG
ncbi:rhamnulokinase [Catellatospora tritici]|uniref:rhamnulokinase n=1 Tax=Catellatospora tritici TaxID=2851566 RepID=UPI001C2D159A|nr:rhamnulokinase family protein [Catellatospora tritici]MBV1851379.1 rhamnulokinase [Catellatospora tritici]